MRDGRWEMGDGRWEMRMKSASHTLGRVGQVGRVGQ